MRKKFLAFMALVSCNSPADDRVGLRPMSNTEDTFYFDTGSHTVSIVQLQQKTINLERISE